MLIVEVVVVVVGNCLFSVELTVTGKPEMVVVAAVVVMVIVVVVWGGDRGVDLAGTVEVVMMVVVVGAIGVLVPGNCGSVLVFT